MRTSHAESSAEARTIGLVSSGHFLNHFYGLALPPLFPLLKMEFGVGYAELGLLASIISLASGVVQLPVGFLVDRFRAGLVLALGLALESLAVLLVGLTFSYAGLVALAVLAGLGASVFHPADYAILSARVRETRLGRAFSLHTFAGHVGWAVAPITVGALTAFWGWRASLIALGAVGLALAAVLFFARASLDRPEGAGTAPSRAEPDGSEGHPLKPLLTPAILGSFVFFLLFSTAMAGFFTFFVAATVARHGTALPEATSALTAFFAGSALGILGGGWIADRTPRHVLVAVVGFGLTAFFIVLVGELALGGVGLIALLGVAGLAHGVVPPSRDKMVRAATPARATGRVFAFVSVGLDIGGVITPLLFGWIMDQGQTRMVYWLTAGLLLAALAVLGAVHRGKPALGGAGAA